MYCISSIYLSTKYSTKAQHFFFSSIIIQHFNNSTSKAR